MPSNGRTTMYLRGIDADLKAQFRARCIAERRTMSDVVQEFMRSVAKKGLPKK